MSYEIFITRVAIKQKSKIKKKISQFSGIESPHLEKIRDLLAI